MLHDISLKARGGQLLVMSGKSGAGKTTLLRILNGELPVRSGTAWVAGVALHAGGRRAARVRRHVGVVFQDYSLVASMTALENVEFAYRVAHVYETAASARERALQALGRVGMGDRLAAFPAELSGGEQQRVAIARAVASGPRVLLADEPTGNLDAGNSVIVASLLEAEARSGALVIVATHEPELFGASQRRLHLDAGRLVEGAARPAWAS